MIWLDNFCLPKLIAIRFIICQVGSVSKEKEKGKRKNKSYLDIAPDSIIFCRVVINADAPYIKMVCEQFDRCHGTLLQFVEFLCSAVTPALAYGQLIPSLDDLVHLYHLDPEVCLLSFSLWLLVILFDKELHL